MLEAVFIVNPISGATDKRNIVALIHKELDSSRFHSQIDELPLEGRNQAHLEEAIACYQTVNADHYKK